MTDFSTQLLRDVIRDHSVQQQKAGIQAFTMRTDEVAVMAEYYRQREQMMSPGDIKAIENLRNSSQALDIYLYRKRALGAGATRVRKGSGSSQIATVVPSFFAVIEEGIDMSFVNQSLRQYGSEGADKKEIIRRAYTDHLSRELPQVFRNIYTRANKQFVNHMETNKWALTGTADAGTLYTTYTGDAKNIPNTEDVKKIIPNMQIEATQNNFLQLGRPSIIGGPTVQTIYNEYLRYGANNDQNAQQFLNWFNPLSDNEISDAVGDDATMYLIANASLAGYQRVFRWDAHPDAVNGVVTQGEDKWSILEIGGEDTMIFSGLPKVTLECKAHAGYQDNSGSFAEDEAKIDIVNSWSFVAQFGGLKAYDPDANVSPILKYILKS